MNADLKTALGPDLFALLTTDGQRAAAAEVFGLICDDSGPEVACAWLIGMNPHLDDEAPLRAIVAGRAAEVLAAAHAYEQAQHA